jgi:hypothetical protein
MIVPQKIKSVKEEKSYGNLYLSSNDLPFVKDLKIGDMTEFEIKVKVTALRMPDRWEVSEGRAKPKDIKADVIILSIEHKAEEKEEKKMK